MARKGTSLDDVVISRSPRGAPAVDAKSVSYDETAAVAKRPSAGRLEGAKPRSNAGTPSAKQASSNGGTPSSKRTRKIVGARLKKESPTGPPSTAPFTSGMSATSSEASTPPMSPSEGKNPSVRSRGSRPKKAVAAATGARGTSLALDGSFDGGSTVQPLESPELDLDDQSCTSSKVASDATLSAAADSATDSAAGSTAAGRGAVAAPPRRAPPVTVDLLTSTAADEAAEATFEAGAEEGAGEGGAGGGGRPVIVEGEMTDAEAACVAGLRSQLEESGTLNALHKHMRVAAETEESYLVRFARARKCKVDDALAMVITNHEWREAEKIDEIADMEARDVLGCELQDIWPYLPCWMQGEDKLGRPIIYKEWGNFWYKEIMMHCYTDQFVKYHIWMNEQGSRALGRQSLKHGRRIDKFTCIFNAGGWQPSSMRHGAMGFVKIVTAIDQQHYPERLACILIINAPRLISLCWSVIKRWLDPVTRDKVQILTAENKWRTVIEDWVDDDQLPDIYGGTAVVQLPTGSPTPQQTDFMP